MRGIRNKLLPLCRCAAGAFGRCAAGAFGRCARQAPGNRTDWFPGPVSNARGSPTLADYAGLIDLSSWHNLGFGLGALWAILGSCSLVPLFSRSLVLLVVQSACGSFLKGIVCANFLISRHFVACQTNC